MAGRIPQIFINELLARTDIVDLISARIKLKKQGKNYQACCPFHNEKTPSFTVNGEKQFYHCFGCGAHGNAIDFLINYDRLEFVESIEELATLHALEVPYVSAENTTQLERHQRQNLYELMEKISAFYQQSLNTVSASPGRRYLAERGLNEEIIHRFGVGFAPRGWETILQRYGRQVSDRKILNDTGMLVIQDNGRSYDRFRERIMFPIRDRRGRVIAFGGRVIGNGLPKYLNSPETDLFHKSRQLYGLYEAQSMYNALPRLLVVEGYMDVIALSQFDIGYAVASLGTATTAEHIQLLFRATDNVICCYDGDKAGRDAAWRTLQTALPWLNDGLHLGFMFLPEGEDPDTLVRKEGKAAFEQRIERAQPLSMFLLETLLTRVDLSTPEGRAKLTSLAAPLINQIPGEALQFYLKQELGNKLGMPDAVQWERQLQKQTKNAHIGQPFRLKQETVHILTGLLIQNPRLATLVPSLQGLEEAELADLPVFTALVNTCLSQPGLTTGQLLEFYRDNSFSQQLETLAMWDHMVAEDAIEQYFMDTLSSLYDAILEKRQDILIARERTQGLNTQERKELWSLNLALAKKK